MVVPVLGGRKFILAKYSLKTVINTQPNVIQVLCWCQRGRKFCLLLLLHSQHQQSLCLPASCSILTWLKIQPITPCIKSLASLLGFTWCECQQMERMEALHGWWEWEDLFWQMCKFKLTLTNCEITPRLCFVTFYHWPAVNLLIIFCQTICCPLTQWA